MFDVSFTRFRAFMFQLILYIERVSLPDTAIIVAQEYRVVLKHTPSKSVIPAAVRMW